MKTKFENEERLEALLNSKDFIDLKSDEKQFVLDELGSEEKYTLMRKISMDLVYRKADLSPDPSILKSLKQHHAVKHRKQLTWVQLLTFKVPAYAIVILLMCIGLLWFSVKPEPQNAALPVAIVKVDTLYMAVKPDTVFIERIIYKQTQLPKAQPDYSFVNNSKKKEETSGSSVSMKENEELESLLVSGSR